MNEPRPPSAHGPTPHQHPAGHAPTHPNPTPGYGIPSPARPAGQPAAPSSHLHNNAVIPAALQRKPVRDEEPLELEGEEPTPSAQSKIHGVSSASGPAATHSWTRNTHKNQTGAVRVRSFHCRLSEQGLEYMDHAVNDWLDRHPDIEVKFTTSTVGPFDGKIKEPALILNVWY